jgi:hypothetical protein
MAIAVIIAVVAVDTTTVGKDHIDDHNHDDNDDDISSGAIVKSRAIIVAITNGLRSVLIHVFATLRADRVCHRLRARVSASVAVAGIAHIVGFCVDSIGNEIAAGGRSAQRIMPCDCCGECCFARSGCDAANSIWNVRKVGRCMLAQIGDCCGVPGFQLGQGTGGGCA